MHSSAGHTTTITAEMSTQMMVARVSLRPRMCEASLPVIERCEGWGKEAKSGHRDGSNDRWAGSGGSERVPVKRP